MHRRSRTSVGTLAAIVGCAIVAAPGIAAAALTAPSSPPERVVQVGSAAILPAQARVLAALPASKPLKLTVALKPRDPAGLASYATDVATPGTALYHHYLSVDQFAQRFGATADQVSAVQAALRAEGLTVGAPLANQLTLPVQGTAGQVEDAFSVSLAQVRTPDGRTTYANREAPSLRATIAGLVQGVIGLDDVTHDQPQSMLASAGVAPLKTRGAARSESQVVTGGPQPCGPASALQSDGYTADQIASAYQFANLYVGGDLGAGQTVAIFEEQPYLPSDIATYQACYGTNATVTPIDVDGGPGAYVPGTSDDGEAALDIEMVAGLAPKANILVYQGPSTANSPVDIIAAMVAQNSAKIITSSWGVCEALTGGSVIAAENTLLQEAATQGQSFFISSGDSGSEQCSQVDPNNTSISVLNPAGQPFATGVGGTLLYPAGPPPSEYVWNAGPRANGGGGTGGGISNQFPMPAYQSGAASSLGVVNPNSSAAPCGSTSLCREVPDVSADADVRTGFIVYVNGGSQGGGWVVIGGTSASAPLWAAFTGLANALPACRGIPIGFANPALYAIAGSSYLNNFNDVKAGYGNDPSTFPANNDTLNGTGLFPVTVGYDMTTGIGTPIGATLAASLCGQTAPVYTVAVGGQGPQTSMVNTPVSLQMGASDSGNAPLAYSASGLPAGLSINAATGLISGVPTAVGTSNVTVGASDRFTNGSTTAFTWTIVAPPVVRPPSSSRPVLSGISKRKAKLRFTITAGANAPAVRALAITLPGGVTFAKSVKSLKKGIVVKSSSGKKLAFAVKIRKGVVTITLAKQAGKVVLTIGKPAVTVSSTLAGKVKHHKVKSLTLTIAVTDAARHTTKLKFKTKAS
jgi:subtilase family serine protease